MFGPFYISMHTLHSGSLSQYGVAQFARALKTERVSNSGVSFFLACKSIIDWLGNNTQLESSLQLCYRVEW